MAVAERTRSIRERPPPPVSLRRFQRMQASGAEVRCRLSSAVPPFVIIEAEREAVAQHWTPHSGRNFLPSATAALGYQKTDRDILGGRSAQASDRKTRLAKQRITVLQLAVADSFSNFAVADPLAESESLENFLDFMAGIGIPKASITATIDLLSSRQFVSFHRVPSMVPQILEEFEPEDTLIDDTLQQDIPEAKPDKRRKLENTRVQQLGSDPKKVRSESRSNLQPGYYVSISGKKDTLLLHRLGACFRVPSIHYPGFRNLGGEMPLANAFQQVCRLCAKAGPLDEAEGGSSETQTSSSSDED